MSKAAAGAAAAADAVEMRLSRRSPRHLHNRNPASSFLSLFQRMMILAEIPPPDARYVWAAEFPDLRILMYQEEIVGRF